MRLIGVEKDIEKIKIELALKDDFNLIDAFGLLDLRGNGYLTPTELRVGLMDLGLSVTPDDLQDLFTKFNTERDDRLKFSEFSDAFMPKDDHYARILGAKRLAYVARAGRCPFEINTLNKYLMAWEMMISNERTARTIRHRLYQQ